MALLAESQNLSEVEEHVGDALRHLHEAWCCARSTKSDPWQFAVELTCLRALGVSMTHLRWLVIMDFVEHGWETTKEGAQERSFRPTTCLAFLARSCFILTQAGERKFFPSDSANNAWSSSPAAHPAWDRSTRELSLGNELVKRFRGPAPNQEGILTAFEEDNWPVRIDDPLPPRSGQDPKRRLHDTINALNRNQKVRSMRFSGDGTGEGVRWEAINDN